MNTMVKNVNMEIPMILTITLKIVMLQGMTTPHTLHVMNLIVKKFINSLMIIINKLLGNILVHLIMVLIINMRIVVVLMLILSVE